MREGGKVRQDDAGIRARIVLRPKPREGRRHVAAHHRLEEIDDLGPVGETQHVAHRLGRHDAGPMGDGLVEERERIARRAFGRAGDGGERLLVGSHPLGIADAAQVRHELVRLDAAQVEALAAGQDRDRDLADFRGGEDELGVGRRLLERLQEGVERLLRQHVDLVDDVDLVAGRDRRIADAVDDLADVVDARMGGGVHLQHVHVPRFHDRLAMDAEAGHVDGRLAGAVRPLVVEAAGEDAGGGGLADAAHAGEHPGLRDAAGVEGVREGADHRLLADQVVEGARAVFSSKNAVGRGRRSSGRRRKTRQGRLVVQGRAGCGFVHMLQSVRIIVGRTEERQGGRLDEDPFGLVRAASFRT